MFVCHDEGIYAFKLFHNNQLIPLTYTFRIHTSWFYFINETTDVSEIYYFVIGTRYNEVDGVP